MTGERPIHREGLDKFELNSYVQCTHMYINVPNLLTVHKILKRSVRCTYITVNDSIQWFHGMTKTQSCYTKNFTYILHITYMFPRLAIVLKPWPNGPPNSSSQLEPSFQLGWSWVSFGHPLSLSCSSWIEFDQAPIFAQLEPSFPPFGHLSHLKPTLAKLFCYYAVVFRH